MLIYDDQCNALVVNTLDGSRDKNRLIGLLSS